MSPFGNDLSTHTSKQSNNFAFDYKWDMSRWRHLTVMLNIVNSFITHTHSESPQKSQTKSKDV